MRGAAHRWLSPAGEPALPGGDPRSRQRHRRVTLLKWSRDNGSIVTRWLDQQPSKPSELIVSSIGRDEVLKFGPGQYVEVSDDQRELRGEAGILVRLLNAEGQVLMLDTTDPNAATVLKAGFPIRSTISQQPESAALGWHRVKPGHGDMARAGGRRPDHVRGGKIPRRRLLADPRAHCQGRCRVARDTATPPNPIPQPRAGVEHHYCKLAVLSHDAGGFKVVQDCRKLFPPLTELVALLYESGDGRRRGRMKPSRNSLPCAWWAWSTGRRRWPAQPCGSRRGRQWDAQRRPAGRHRSEWHRGVRVDAGQRGQRQATRAGRASRRRQQSDPGSGSALQRQPQAAVLLYVSGDGQEAMPNRALPQPLRARVVSEQVPVIGAQVEFTVAAGGGRLPAVHR